MDRDKVRGELDRLVAEAPTIAPSIVRFGLGGSYGNVTDEDLDASGALRGELEAAAILQDLVRSAPVLADLHDRYLDRKRESKRFHSRSIFVHQLMQLLISARQLLDSPLTQQEPPSGSPSRIGDVDAHAPSRPTATAPTIAELAFPEKVTIAWAIRHVPLSFWSYLAGLFLSVFLAGIAVGQLPFVRSIVTRVQDEGIQPARPPADADEQIRRLTEGHTQRVTKLTEGIVAEEQAAGRERWSTEQRPHVEAAQRLREMVREENDSFQKALAQLKALRPGQR